MLIYTSQAEALRDVIRDAFGWSFVDTGDGWLIFEMPPAEIGVHPGDAPAHEISLMCDDLEATMSDLSGRGVEFEGAPSDEGWGIVVKMVLPGGVPMTLYEPRHGSPLEGAPNDG